MERLNLRTSGLSYNPAVTQTSCVSLPLWSPFQDVTRSSVFISICFVVVFLIVLLSHLHKAKSNQLVVPLWKWRVAHLKTQIWLQISVPGWPGAHGKGFTPTLDATAGTHSCLNRMLMKEKHRKSLGFGTHTHMRTLSRSLFADVGVRYTIRLYVNQFRRSRRGLGS